MKIAYVIPHADTRRGGAEAYLNSLSQQVAQKGHEVTVLCQTSGTFNSDITLKTYTVSGTESNRLLMFWQALDHDIPRLQFDVVHALDVCPHATFYNPHGGCEKVWLDQYLKSKTGLNRLISQFKRRFGRRQKVMFDLERRTLQDKALKKIIAISPFVKDSFQQTYQLDDDLFELVPNGTDTTRFDVPDNDQREKLRQGYLGGASGPFILFVAHNFALKGIIPFLKTVAQLVKIHPQLQAWVVGNGKPMPYRGLIRSLGLGKHVAFKGRVPSLVEVYQAADLLLAPSYYDACSLSTLEALLCGTPVVTTRTNGAHLYLTQSFMGGTAGNANDIPQLTSLCEQVLAQDPAYRPQIAEKVAGYTLESNAKAILDVYDKVKSERRL